VAPYESSIVNVTPRRRIAFAGTDSGHTVVWLRGEHDTSNAPVLSAAMACAMSLDDSDVVIDLSDVRFLDASTIGVISKARDHLVGQSRSMSLRAPSPCARLLLDVCGLSEAIVPATDAAGALGTWVAVPTSDRANPFDTAPTPATVGPPVS
jgi:anti-anti-sigma factor